MKCVILAGGLGTRIHGGVSEKPKPLVEIGGIPILWHIMKIYSAYDVNEFIICCGYKGYQIKEFFSNYYLHMSNVSFDLKNNKMEILDNVKEPWKVTLADTGISTMTGGRIKRIKKFVQDETFCLTYGDGLADLNISNLIDHHLKNKTLATVLGVRPPVRYGSLNIEKKIVTEFNEKTNTNGEWINGGFFVLEPGIFKYIKNDFTMWEREPLEKLAEDGQLSVHLHQGFWHPMDTPRDQKVLQELWDSGNPPWKVW